MKSPLFLLRFFFSKDSHKRLGGNFYFGFLAVLLSAFLFSGSNSLAQLSYVKKTDSVFNNFFKNTASATYSDDLFFSQNRQLALETPDLKLVGDDFLYGITTPRVLTTQVLGNIFGSEAGQKRDVVNYVVVPGDTIESVAAVFNITSNTIIWANELSKGSALKVGQTLVILPVSGLTHVVKSGDTVSDIAKTYKTTVDEIVSFNNLINEGDIFVGDIIIVPGGVMPSRVISNGQAPLPDSFFIFPAEGIVTQGLHYYNGVDVANKCGSPIYAAAAGTVQRAVGNGGWNLGMGNHVTILHSNGVVTYYGHLLSLFVKPGDRVNVGDRIGLMGKTGAATGCHVHFQVIGAKNPLAKYSVGAQIKY